MCWMTGAGRPSRDRSGLAKCVNQDSGQLRLLRAALLNVRSRTIKDITLIVSRHLWIY